MVCVYISVIQEFMPNPGGIGGDVNSKSRWHRGLSSLPSVRVAAMPLCLKTSICFSLGDTTVTAYASFMYKQDGCDGFFFFQLI